MGVEFEVDHIQPRRAGGVNTPDNLCLSCPTCNRCKSARLYAPDPETGRTARLFHPKRDRWEEHFAWDKSVTRIFGLTPTGRATAAALRFNREVMVALRRYWRALGVKLED